MKLGGKKIRKFRETEVAIVQPGQTLVFEQDNRMISVRNEGPAKVYLHPHTGYSWAKEGESTLKVVE